MHLVYDATHHAVIPRATELTALGEVTDRFERKGREHVVVAIEVRDKVTGQIYTTYTDTSILQLPTGVRAGLQRIGTTACALPSSPRARGQLRAGNPEVGMASGTPVGS